ncbi:MAG: decarboxylating NADP(+)-dependent phosphogluconate dehydrogenase [Psittacicella sp.]
MKKGDIGVVGLAVMGQNLILNMNDHGFNVVVFNRTTSKVDHFLENEAKGTNIQGSHSIEELVSKLETPRKVMLMVKAGAAVQQFIDLLVPHLEAGDIIIDGGNSEYTDTIKRCAELEEKGILYVGSGISGGEEGARFGPSIMPGGNPKAWPHVKPILQAIAAKTDKGEPCCDWVGNSGAGHFVKMVHNGIEYGDMQLISEAYDFMRRGLNLNDEQLKDTFTKWNETELNSYLIEITYKILGYKENDELVLHKILDAAGQKGTGKWTGINALNQAVPLTLITESVFARCISALKEDRISNSKTFNKTLINTSAQENIEEVVELVRQALLASKIISYAQGFMLIRQASEEFGWNLNYGNTALLWREGCIIRSSFLEKIRDAYKTNPDLVFLGNDTYFKAILENCQAAWRKVLVKSIELGIPMPCTAAGLLFLDSYTTETLPANLIQAQRDFFGAHTYERADKKRGEFFHTDWTGEGGNVFATTYNA